VRLVAVNRLVPGMILGRDVSTLRPGGMPLLRRGAVVAEGYRDRLLAAGIHAVWIDDELGRGIEPVAPLSPELRQAAEAAATRTLTEAGEAIGRGGTLPPEALDDIQRLAGRIAAELADCAPATLALQDLASADAYTHRHSVQVTVIGLLIAGRHLRRHGWVDAAGRRRYDQFERRMATLGFGLLVHDIGKLIVPIEVLNKPGPLTAEEWDIVRRHPRAGVDLLPSSTVSRLALAVVRSHHERWDGTGYPDGRAGERIHIFPRIAAVADVYDAVTSERPYRGAAPPHEGVRAILAGAGTAFDRQVVDTFREVVMPFPVGHPVQLPDGREAVVAAVDPGDPDRPVVRFAEPGHPEQRVDLSGLLRTAGAA
jgi:HD-GYP domain-containing protein (c-di-GMP phosphodiesterase class II)